MADSFKTQAVIELVDEYTSKLKKIVGENEKATKKVNKSWENAAKSIGGAFKVVGVAAAGFAAGAVAYATKKTLEFQDSMTTLKVQANLTAQEYESFQKAALESSKKSTFSANEHAQAMIELSKAGMSSAAILGGGYAAALNLARLGGIGAAEAGELLTDTINAFNLKATDSARVANQLVGAANKSSASIADISYAFNQSSSVANGLKISLEEVSATLAFFATQSLKGSDAGTSFKTFLQRLSAPTSESIKMMKKLGIVNSQNQNTFFTSAGKLKTLAEVSQILQDKTKKLTDQQKMQALSTMFGSDAIRAANLLAKAGASELNNMAKEIASVNAQQQVNQMNNDSWIAQTQILKNNIEALAIPKLTEWITNNSGKILEFTNNVIPAIEVVAKLAYWIAKIATFPAIKAGEFLGETIGNIKNFGYKFGYSGVSGALAPQINPEKLNAYRARMDSINVARSQGASTTVKIDNITVGAGKVSETEKADLQKVFSDIWKQTIKAEQRQSLIYR